MGPLAFLAGGFALATAATALLRPLARRLGAVAPPRPDRWNPRPTPLLGGIAIAIPVAAAALLLPPGSRDALVLVAGASALGALGLLDDLRPLSPRIKLASQILVALGVVTLGLALEPTSSLLVNALFSVVWLVAITNAFNLLDNMDGLAAGVAAIATGFRLVFLVGEGDLVGADLSAAFLGALLGFLVFNSSPASIFMGDAGSMFVGFLLGGLSLASPSAHSRSLVSVLVLPVLVLLVPIFDTIFVTLTRILANRAVSAGARDHTSHRLVQLGFSEREAVGMLYLAALVGGATAYFSRVYGFAYGLVFATLLLVGTALAGLLLAQVRTPEPRPPLEGERLLRRLLLRIPYRRQAATMAADLVSIALAYYCAYILRFDELSGPVAARFSESLPLAIACQALALALFRTHRVAWRYPSLRDALRLVKATLLGVALTAFGILGVYRFAGYSRAVLVLDGALLLLLLGATRLAFLALADLLRARSPEARSVLVYGAGDLGELALRQLLRGRSCSRRPIGLLDDDPDKRGLEIHGFPVLGSGAELAAILRSRPVEEVVVAEWLSPERAHEIEATCRSHAVHLLPVTTLFE